MQAITTRNPVVSRDDWLAARRELLSREKEATRLRDQVNAARLALPWSGSSRTTVEEIKTGA